MMKIRQGFVSNSSSSSFIIKESDITNQQKVLLYKILENPIGQYKDSWEVYAENGEILGYTNMENNDRAEGIGSIFRFLEIDQTLVKYGDY